MWLISSCCCCCCYRCVEFIFCPLDMGYNKQSPLHQWPMIYWYKQFNNFVSKNISTKKKYLQIYRVWYHIIGGTGHKKYTIYQMTFHFMHVIYHSVHLVSLYYVKYLFHIETTILPDGCSNQHQVTYLS